MLFTVVITIINHAVPDADRMVEIKCGVTHMLILYKYTLRTEAKI